MATKKRARAISPSDIACDFLGKRVAVGAGILMTVEVFWGGGRGEVVFAVAFCVGIIAMVVCDGGGGEFGYWGGGVGGGVGVAHVLIFRYVVLYCAVRRRVE